MVKENSRLLLIFLIALGLRLTVFIAAGSWQNELYEKRIVHNDSIEYKKLALNLTRNKTFSRSERPPYHPELFYTPVYPSFLASIYAASGYKPYIPILFQLFIGSATCLFIYRIGKILFDDKTALLSGLFLAFEYSSILYSNALTTETLFTFLFVVHIFFLVKFITSYNNKWLAYSSLFLGIATLTRPVSVYFFIFLSVIFVIHFRKNLGKGILKYSFFTLIFLAVIAPWVVRNHAVSGRFIVSSVQDMILGWTYAPIERSGVKKAQHQGLDIQQDLMSTTDNTSTTMKMEKDVDFDVKKFSKEFLFATLRFFLNPSSSSYPRHLGMPYKELEIKDSGKNLWQSFKLAILKKSKLERFIFFFSIGFLIFLYSALSVGVYGAIRENKIEALMLLFVVIIYLTTPSVLISQTNRYRVPIMPFVILISCYGMTYFKKVLKNTRHDR